MIAARFSRRRLLVCLAGTAAGVGLASACAPIGPSAEQTNSESDRQPASAAPGQTQAKRGGTLTYAQVFPLSTTDPHPSTGSVYGYFDTLFNPLVAVDINQQPQPMLADSWTLASNRLAMTFKLRDGVTFHSGNPFTAEDAKWNLEYAQDPVHKVQVGSLLQGVQATAVDASTLELRFPAPMPQIFSLLVGVPIIDPTSDIAKAVGGTGPFKLESFTPGDQLRMTRYEQYWRKGYPMLDAVVIKVIPDPNTMLINLQTGAADVINGAPPNELKQLATGATRVFTRPGPGNYDFLLSTVDKPFDTKQVRQAMGLAIDRQRFADAVLFGFSEPAYTPWSKGSMVWDTSLDAGEFNLDKAKAMLADAGYPNGFETRIQASAAQAENVQAAQMFQADLAKIGVTAGVDLMEASQFSSVLIEARFGGMVTHSHLFADQDPALLFTALPFNPDRNASRFQSPEYKRMVEAAQAETDQIKRISEYRDITRLIQEEAFYLPIANFRFFYGLRANVQGFRTNALHQPDFEEVWLA